ncbi:MAG TPA: hypothetical protein VMR31_04700 [Myxococcota bacterium]|nr:hypothetical protein [Myxococcota bacterium]
MLASLPARAGNFAAAGVLVGFARVNLTADTVTVVTAGGHGTKFVTAGSSGGSGMVVLFHGKFPKTLANSDVVVQATADANSDEHAVANAVVTSVAQDLIVVTVNAFVSTTGAAVDGDVCVSVLAGRPPVD